jgi:hypothetical protein
MVRQIFGFWIQLLEKGVFWMQVSKFQYVCCAAQRSSSIASKRKVALHETGTGTKKFEPPDPKKDKR